MSQGIIIVLVSVYHFCFLVCLVFFLLLFQVQSPSVRAYSVTNLIFFFNSMHTVTKKLMHNCFS